MIKHLKNKAKWIIPYQIYINIKRYKKRISIPNEILLKCSNNKRFRNIHEGKRCFILASGPSIKNQDLKVLSNEICFAVSNFCLHKDINYIKPEYQILAPWHHPFTFEDLDKIFDKFKSIYNYNIHYFFGYDSYKYSIYNYLILKKMELSKNISLVNHQLSEPIDDLNFKDPNIWDISKIPFSIRTVLYSAIQIAVYMGFKEIILLGCDHNYLKLLFENDGNIKNHHFYNEKDGAGQKEIEHLASFSMERWFKEYYYRWKEFRLMQEYLTEKGIKIINATEGSMLNVFPKYNFNQIIDGSY